MPPLRRSSSPIGDRSRLITVASQPHETVAAIDVDRLAGDAAGEVAEQIEAGGTKVFLGGAAAEGGFPGGVLAEFVEAGDAGGLTVRIGPALMQLTRICLAEIPGQVTHAMFEGGFADAHHVVAGNHFSPP